MTSRNLWTTGGLAVLAIWAAYVLACTSCSGCGAPPTPAEASPPPVEGGVACRANDAGSYPCCDGGRWVCTTTEVPCVCPP